MDECPECYPCHPGCLTHWNIVPMYVITNGMKILVGYGRQGDVVNIDIIL